MRSRPFTGIIPCLFSFALGILTIVPSLRADISLTQNLALTAWPESVTISTGDPLLGSTAVSGSSTLIASQTITPSTDMWLGGLYFAYSTTTNSGATSYSIRVQEVTQGPSTQTYTLGADLFPVPLDFALTSTAGAKKLVKFTFTNTDSLSLKAGKTYAIEISSKDANMVKFYRRGADSYSGGNAYSNRSAVNWPGTRDLAMAALAGEGPVMPSPFGIASSGEATAGYAAFLPKLVEAGVSDLRAFPLWAAVEPTNNSFNFSTADAMLNAAESQGITINGKFAMSAPWAAATWNTFPMGHLDDWADYIQTMTARYQGRIHYWEVWNEPNAVAFNAGGHTPADYATLVIRAYDAAKAGDPNCQVGLTVANFDLRYIVQVLQSLSSQGALDKFDFIAVHPYELLGRIGGKDGEIYYLSIVDSVRKLLAVHAPGKENIPIRFTELSTIIGGSVEGTTITEALAASYLTKAYVLGIVQGAESVQWFEVKDAGGSQNFGILDDNLTERASFRAYKTITNRLGSVPDYLGWLALGAGGNGLGFVFDRDGTKVMTAWMPAGTTGQTSFTSNVQVVNLDGVVTNLTAGQQLNLTSTPVYVIGVPSALVTQAQANLVNPYPWGSSSVNANLAKIDLGPTNVDQGVVQDAAHTSVPYTFGDGTTGQQVNLPGYTHAAYFSVDPSFADFNTSTVYVRVTARRVATGTSCGMKLLYQRKDGTSNYTSTGGWWSLANNLNAQTHTFSLTNAMFVNTWGYSLWLQFDNSAPFVIQKVEVSKVPF